MNPYSPFGKTISELDTAALSILREVPEGWYVEYKRNDIPPTNLAKTIAAFANTYGGWLFLGVEESSAGDRTAEHFPGLDAESRERVFQWLRQSVAAHINPMPYYESAALTGPCDTIGLADNKTVIVLYVPQSIPTPHLHSNGRVYVRVSDSSEPRPLNERYLLDQLWHRGDRVRERIQQWVQGDPEFSKGESEIPYLRLMFSPDLWDTRQDLRRLSHAVVRDTLAGGSKNGMNIPLNSIYPTSDGIIARQTVAGDPHTYGLTLHLKRDLSCDIVIPLIQYEEPAADLRAALESRYRHVDRFIQILESQGHYSPEGIVHPRVVDLTMLLFILMDITRKYGSILQLVDDQREYYCKARILHGWRRIPFIDVPLILERFAKHGVPILPSDEITVPIGEDPESFLCLRNPDADSHSIERNLDDGDHSQAVRLFIHLSLAFGITGLGIDIDDTLDDLIKELSQAVGRAATSAIR